ncbi:uncharacterized protein B0H64DRAFT_445581 [Chaetomium fimeti]|uniref:Uncharacterized protein n=1 Tax=Chaetomium fimeti TaxID=1854472 RepID=A0AAE0HA36_9PEZI|nr:hypothetical protein B0H64DRAFT_445581 [Chaetomium fimeti]
MSLLHLETHNPNRPPPQIPYKRGRRNSFLANTYLPPHRILRLTHLYYLNYTLSRRMEHLREDLAHTKDAAEKFLSPTTTTPTPKTNPPWPPDDPTPHHHHQPPQPCTPLTQQASTMALTLGSHPPPPNTTPRIHQIHHSPPQLTHLCHLRLLAQRQRRALREGRWLREHGPWLTERAERRTKGWLKRRGEKYSMRRVAGREVRWWEGWRGRLVYGWELDAWRWGVALRRGVLGKGGTGDKSGGGDGGGGVGGWPGQEWFEIYKMVRYGWTEAWGLGEDREGRARREAEMEMERGGFKQAYGSGMLLMGSSPLRRTWTPVCEEV